MGTEITLKIKKEVHRMIKVRFLHFTAEEIFREGRGPYWRSPAK